MFGSSGFGSGKYIGIMIRINFHDKILFIIKIQKKAIRSVMVDNIPPFSFQSNRVKVTYICTMANMVDSAVVGCMRKINHKL